MVPPVRVGLEAGTVAVARLRMPRRRWVLTLIGAGVHVLLVSGCVGALAAKNDLALMTDYLPEGDTATPFDPKPERVAPNPERTTVDHPPPPPPAPEKPTPKPIERTPEVPGPIPPTPPPPDPPAIAALRAYLENRPVATSELLQLLWPIVASASMREMERGPQGVAVVQENVKLLAATLRSREPLMLTKVCFTRSIEGFGVYEPLPAPDGCPVFQCGLDGRPGDRVQVYVEVRNFASRMVGPYWETALASTLEIRSMSVVDDQGSRPPVVLRRPARPDRSLSPRQDYFLNIQFHIPPRLPPGRYQVHVEVRDEITARVNRDRILEFRVEAPR
jgi:hypothetical protein